MPKHDDAARDFTLAVEFGQPAPHVGAELNSRDIAKLDRNAARRGFERHRAEIIERGQIARGADNIFGLGHFDYRAAGFLISTLQCIGDLLVRDAVGHEFLGIEHDLILLDHAADARRLGDAGHRFQFIAQEPVLDASQL